MYRVNVPWSYLCPHQLLDFGILLSNVQCLKLVVCLGGTVTGALTLLIYPTCAFEKLLFIAVSPQPRGTLQTYDATTYYKASPSSQKSRRYEGRFFFIQLYLYTLQTAKRKKKYHCARMYTYTYSSVAGKHKALRHSSIATQQRSRTHIGVDT